MRWRAVMGAVGALLCMHGAASAQPASVAMLRYGAPVKTSVCFNDAFLQLVAMETSAAVSAEFVTVELGSAELFGAPMAVMTGEGAFALTEAEIENLRAYVSQGGFVLVSAGCSSEAWAESARRALGLAFPAASLTPLAPDHEVFHALYDINEFVSRRRAPVAIEGLEIDGRLAVIFSAQGLNDSAGAGVDEHGASCCCCAGDEIVGARFLNANILLYAMLR